MNRLLQNLKFRSNSENTHFYQRIFSYLKRVVSDYAASGRDTFQSIRTNPIRSTLYASMGCCLYTAIHFCPTERDYYAALVNAGIDIWEVPDLIRNPRSLNHVSHRYKLFIKNQIRSSHFGIINVIWRDDRTKSCCQYVESCKYTYPASGGGDFTALFRLLLFDRPDESGWRRFVSIIEDRVLDVGFLGQWWLMSRAMQDYDVNPSEWEAYASTSGSTQFA